MIITNEEDAKKLLFEIFTEAYRTKSRKITVRGIDIQFDSNTQPKFALDGTLIMAVYETIKPSTRGKQAKQFNVSHKVIQGPLIDIAKTFNGSCYLVCDNFYRSRPEVGDEVAYTRISTNGRIKAISIGEPLPKELVDSLV